MGRFGGWLARLTGRTDDPRRVALAEWRRRAVAAAEQGTADDVAALLAELESAGWDHDEVDLDVERLEGRRVQLALTAAIDRDGLPVVETQHRVVGHDVCHFRAPAFLANDGHDATGTLLLTNRRLVFLAADPVALRWSEVRKASALDRDLVVVPVARGLVYRIRLNTFADAARAFAIARRLLPNARP